MIAFAAISHIAPELAQLLPHPRQGKITIREES